MWFGAKKKKSKGNIVDTLGLDALNVPSVMPIQSESGWYEWKREKKCHQSMWRNCLLFDATDSGAWLKAGDRQDQTQEHNAVSQFTLWHSCLWHFQSPVQEYYWLRWPFVCGLKGKIFIFHYMHSLWWFEPLWCKTQKQWDVSILFAFRVTISFAWPKRVCIVKKLCSLLYPLHLYTNLFMKDVFFWKH